MKNMRDFSELYDFYDNFISVSRKRLEEILKKETSKEKDIVKSNLDTCLKDYGLVTKLTDRLLKSKEDGKLLSNLEIEYKYHNKTVIENAYFNSIDYVNRIYHAIGEDFIKAIKENDSLQSIYLAEVEFHSMLESFISNYSEIVNKSYVPVLKIII
ncbi:MAG: hypothetical protein QXL94_03410 [Candidatus Parvarchaeum sp.]